MLNKKELNENAVFVLSGKLLDKPFDLNSIAPLLRAVESSLSDRDVIVTRRIVTLSDAHAVAAPDFLKAGFEALPADDEDLQAAAIMISIVDSARPDELVFALGESEPIRFLRLLAGKTRRVLLTSEKIEDGEKFLHNVEGILEANDLLNKAGFNPAQFKLISWSERSGGEEGTPEQPPVETTTDKSSVVAEAPTPQTDAQEDAVDSLCQTTEYDSYEDLKASADEWNGELEAFLLENDKTFSAAQAIGGLELHFPGISRLFYDKRDEFRKLLDEEKIRLLEEDGKPATFYHATHESMRPVDFANFQANVASTSISSSTPTSVPVHVESQETEQPASFVALPSFKEEAVNSDILSRQCSWSAERAEIMSPGRIYDYDLDIGPRDREIEALAKEARLYLWPLNRFDTSHVTSDNYREMAKLYSQLKEVFELLDRVQKDRSKLDPSFVVRGLQIAADSQCLVKTALRKLGVAIGRDPVQRAAFNLISDFRREHYPTRRLDHMRADDSVNLSEFPALKQRLEEYRKEYEKRIARIEAVDNDLGKLKFHCNKLLSANPQTDYDFEQYNNNWKSVVDTVTTLCQEHGEPFSSARLREPLIDLIDYVPDNIETTNEFARVCQEIDLVRMNEEESFISVGDTKNYPEEVLAVRRHYEGTKAVFVGGTPTPHIRERLAKALGFEVIWDMHDHGDSLDRFNSSLNSSDVKLFMVYIPWCSHMHSRELKTRVEAAGKDFVRIRKGTSPGQIANAICAQIDMKDDELIFSAMENAEPLGDDE